MNKQALVFLIVLVLLLFYIALAPPSTKWNKREITVQKGDTLWALSDRFCSESIDRRWWISQVKKINNTNGNIKKGQVLIILEEERNNGKDNFKTKK